METEKRAAERQEKAAQKGYVEKGNKDEPFRYHIAKVEEEDDSLQETPVITNEDLVLGIRPEFLDIADKSSLEGEIYGAMPTGMESTIKVRVGGFLLTGVIFGSSPVYHRRKDPAVHHRRSDHAVRPENRRLHHLREPEILILRKSEYAKRPAERQDVLHT